MNFLFNASFFVQVESEKGLLGPNIINIVFKFGIFAGVASLGEKKIVYPSVLLQCFCSRWNSLLFHY